MSKILATSIVIVALFSAGCANLNRAVRDEQKIPITVYNSGEKVHESGALFLWPPSSSAAVVDKDGKHCVLAASGAKSVDASSEAAAKLGKALEKIQGLEASMKSSIVESFSKITAADAHAAFADIALFHLCMLEQNGAFKKDEPEKRKLMMDAYLKAVEAARDIK